MPEDEDLFGDDKPKGPPPKIQCPMCGSNDVRRSAREGFAVAFWGLFGRWPFRCRSCRRRFFRHAPPPPDD